MGSQSFVSWLCPPTRIDRSVDLQYYMSFPSCICICFLMSNWNSTERIRGWSSNRYCGSDYNNCNCGWSIPTAHIHCFDALITARNYCSLEDLSRRSVDRRDAFQSYCCGQTLPQFCLKRLSPPSWYPSFPFHLRLFHLNLFHFCSRSSCRLSEDGGKPSLLIFIFLPYNSSRCGGA